MQQRACLVRHRHYPYDARMDNQIQALIAAGFQVDVLCMRRPDEPSVTRDGRLHIRRLPSLQRKRAGKLRYVAEYGTFFLLCFIYLGVLQARRSYQVVHVHTLPDFLVFSALIPKLLGSKVVLDLRECTPEMYQVMYGVAQDSLFRRGLIAIEQASIRFADTTVTCTEQMRDRLIERGADPQRVHVVLNTPNEHIFRDPNLPDPDAPRPATFRIVTHGTITQRYGHEVLVKAMRLVTNQAPEARLEIMGQGPDLDRLKALVQSLGLERCINFTGFLPLEEMLSRLRQAHCGVVSIIRTAESDLVHTYKMQEYIALGLPAVVTRTTAVEAVYDSSSLLFFESGDAVGLAQALLSLRDDPALRWRLASNALRRYRLHGAAEQQARYRVVIDQLLTTGSSSVTDVPSGLSRD